MLHMAEASMQGWRSHEEAKVKTMARKTPERASVKLTTGTRLPKAVLQAVAPLPASHRRSAAVPQATECSNISTPVARSPGVRGRTNGLEQWQSEPKRCAMPRCKSTQSHLQHRTCVGAEGECLARNALVGKAHCVPTEGCVQVHIGS